MSTIAMLVVEIIANAQQYFDTIDDVEKKTSTFSDKALGGLSAIGGGIVAGGLAVAGAGVTALGVGLTQATQAAMEAQGIQAQLEAVLKSTGGAAGVTSDMATELASNLGNLTAFEDDAIVSGESMLLTFTNIGADVFPATTETMLDMSQALGQDLQSSAMQLGKALNDPIAGIGALSRVGVTFTTEQENMIKAMMDAGDTAGAQKVILAELHKEFGGSAITAGSTAEGVWVRMGNIWGNLLETVGTGLLPVLTELGNTLATALSNPATVAFVEGLATQIAGLARSAIEFLPQVIDGFKSLFGWLQENQGVIVAALAVIGAAIAAFAYTSLAAAIPALVAFVAASWPVMVVIAAIGAAAYLLFEAWTNNWGGIQETTAAVWAWLEPKFSAIAEWLKVNIPLAIQWLSDLWTNTLLPAMQAVWAWVDAHLMPLFRAVGDLLGKTLFSSTGSLANIFKTVLGPALDYIVWAGGNLMKVLEFIAPYVGDYVAWAFGNLTAIIDGITSAIETMSNALGNIDLPWWLTPGSPTPWEIALWGVGDALSNISGSELPTMRAQLALQMPKGEIYGLNGLAGGSMSGLAPSAMNGLRNGGSGGGTGGGLTIVINDNSIMGHDTDEVVNKLTPALDQWKRSNS